MSAEQNVTEVPVHPASQTSDEESFGGSGGYELDEDGQRIPHGMGQSKSSRRRRRKRKGKSGDAAASTGQASGQPNGQANAGGEPGVVSSVQANGEVQAAPQTQGFVPGSQPGFRQSNGQGRGFQSNGGGQPNGQSAPGGTKRWKKKFRERDRNRGEHNGGQQGQQNFAGNGNGGGQPQNGGVFRGPDTHQPGNSVLGFKRKGGFGGGGKQQRNGGGGAARGFVGPMDHSYRVVNGNVFETPPATIDPYGNGNGGGSHGGRNRSYQSDSQPIDYSQGRVIPIAEGTPTKIYFFIDDLFFTAKIQETARKLGVKVAFVKNEKEQIAALTSGEEEDRPGLIVFDLNNANAKPLTLIPKLKAKLKKTTSIIGFLSHIQGDLKAKAVEAGCDTVMPRAAFSQNLPNLLRRYGIEDIEEPNYNQ
jgi:CheY-like chemotaxis protein